MPNWCHNNLTVEGPAEEVIAFVNKARQAPKEANHDQPLFFANFVPEPEYENSSDWWDWRIHAWGTKWEPNFEAPPMALGTDGADPGAEKDRLSLEEVDENDLRVSYEFDTAWAPPIPVILAASTQHPHLRFSLSYGEPGGDFGGLLHLIDGLSVLEEEGRAEDYLPPEKMWF